MSNKFVHGCGVALVAGRLYSGVAAHASDLGSMMDLAPSELSGLVQVPLQIYPRLAAWQRVNYPE